MIAHDNFYRYALNKDGQIVHVTDVNEGNRRDGYKCVSCGCELTPALGQKNAHHFRHKTDTCSYESYIHKLWKKYIFEQWQKISHLYVSYYVEHYCEKAPTCKLRDTKSLKCNNTIAPETVDLKERYDTCEIEGSYGGYRADLLLTNSKNPGIVPTFIEICYKHSCDERKQHAGIPIVELKVIDDNLHLPQELFRSYLMPISELNKRHFGNESVVLYGFDYKKRISHNVRRFYVYQDENGVNHGKVDKAILSCHSIDAHLPNSILEIFVEEECAEKEEQIFELGISAATKHGIKIRHCIQCKFYGNRGQTCQLLLPTDKESWLININDLSDLELDKTNYTLLCRYYQILSAVNVNVNLDNTPYIVWKNNSYIKTPIIVPKIINIKARITKDRLSSIALSHIVVQK